VAVATHAPALVYLIPTHQNPVGSVMAAAARRSVVALARRYPDVMFVEDMTLAEVALAEEPRAEPRGVPLGGLAPDLPNLVTIGSLSKVYWGGLRTGWVRAPAGVAARLAAAKSAADLGSTAYQQGIVAALIRGQHDSIVAWRVSWARARLSALSAGLRSWLPSWTWEAPAGGLTIWARLPGDADSSAFAQAALRRGVAVVPGRLLSAAGGGSSYVRVAFTREPAELSAACAILAEV